MEVMALGVIENRTILIGDVLDKIKEIPNDSIDCTISSPPYVMGFKGLWSSWSVGFRTKLPRLFIKNADIDG